MATDRVFPRFGSEVEYAEPAWYQGLPTPFYDESHVELRERVRSFVERELVPHASAWDEQEDSMPIKDLCKKMVAANIYGGSYPPELGGGAGVPRFDAFHALIVADELARTGAGGVTTALNVGVAIGLGPVLAGGSEPVRSRVASEVLRAEKFICLAVTEATAGSDVSALRTRAVLDPSGRYFVVTGEKKFISGAAYADYFTTAVRTDKGISVLLIERGPGVSVRRLKTQGWLASSTGFVVFDQVRVPVENLLGAEGAGFMVIMLNFNNERFGMIASSLRLARLCYEHALRYARARTTFGKPLWSNQVIRSKVAEMVRRIESGHSWIERVAYAMRCGVDPGQIAGQIALLKVHATQAFEFCAREASQIFGGASYLRSGPGEVVERLYREVRVMAIGGGSEEIMNDLAMRRLRAKL